MAQVFDDLNVTFSFFRFEELLNFLEGQQNLLKMNKLFFHISE